MRIEGNNVLSNEPLQYFDMYGFLVLNRKWSDDYIVTSNNNRHSVGYNMLFIIDENVCRWEWRSSGNPDIDGDGKRDGPYRPSDSDAAIIADAYVNYPGWCNSNWKTPRYANHVNIDNSCIPPPDADVLYGDGHVEMYTKVAHYVFRVFSPAWYAW